MEEEEERREGEKKDMAVWFSITLLLYVSFVLCLCVVSVSLLPLLFRPMPCLTSFTLKTSQINSHYHSMLEWYTVGLCWNPLSLSRSLSSSSSSLSLSPLPPPPSVSSSLLLPLSRALSATLISGHNIPSHSLVQGHLGFRRNWKAPERRLREQSLNKVWEGVTSQHPEHK